MRLAIDNFAASDDTLCSLPPLLLCRWVDAASAAVSSSSSFRCCCSPAATPFSTSASGRSAAIIIPEVAQAHARTPHSRGANGAHDGYCRETESAITRLRAAVLSTQHHDATTSKTTSAGRALPTSHAPVKVVSRSQSSARIDWGSLYILLRKTMQTSSSRAVQMTDARPTNWLRQPTAAGCSSLAARPRGAIFSQQATTHRMRMAPSC
jgi:hypothetical protein